MNPRITISVTKYLFVVILVFNKTTEVAVRYLHLPYSHQIHIDLQNSTNSLIRKATKLGQDSICKGLSYSNKI